MWMFGSPGDPAAIDTFNKNANMSTTGDCAGGACESFSDFDAMDLLTEADDDMPEAEEADAARELPWQDEKRRYSERQNRQYRFVRDWFINNPDGNWGDCYPQMLWDLNKQEYLRFRRKDKFDRCQQAQEAFNRIVRDASDDGLLMEIISPSANEVWIEGEKYRHDKQRWPQVSDVAKAATIGLQAYVRGAQRGWRK